MILSGHNLSKSFTEKVIIRDASFVIEEHEKAAVVGINGAGKSTLLKMIVGELAPDEGEVILSRGKTLGYLAQQKMLTGSGTIWEELLSVKQDVLDAEKRMRSLEQEMKHLSGQDLEDAMDQYHRLNTWFEQVNGYAMESEITGVLKGLGFQEEDFHKHTDTLSGGQKTRVALGRLLLQAPDIILLDEPTNHLDMNSIAWLENYLLNYKGAVIIVAHDRIDFRQPAAVDHAGFFMPARFIEGNIIDGTAGGIMDQHQAAKFIHDGAGPGIIRRQGRQDTVKVIHFRASFRTCTADRGCSYAARIRAASMRRA